MSKLEPLVVVMLACWWKSGFPELMGSLIYVSWVSVVYRCTAWPSPWRAALGALGALARTIPAQ